MRRLSGPCGPSVLAVVVGAVSVASAQDQVVVSLPFNSPQTAGPRAQDYPPPQDNLDLWVLEDFTLDRAWALTQFSCFGNGFGPLTDVVAVRMKAVAEDKPIVICYTGGAGYNEPLGVC